MEKKVIYRSTVNPNLNKKRWLVNLISLILLIYNSTSFVPFYIILITIMSRTFFLYQILIIVAAVTAVFMRTWVMSLISLSQAIWAICSGMTMTSPGSICLISFP